MIAPREAVSQPYVIALAFGDIPSGATVELRGAINYVDFVCKGSPCQLILPGDAIITFKVYVSPSYISPEYQATVRVVYTQNNNYEVTVVSFSPQAPFVDSCAKAWNLVSSPYDTWASFPGSPLELNTNLTLHFLTSRLIENGLVNVSDCPNGGFDNYAPNGCAIERSRDVVTEWQNQFDGDIWLAGKQVGIPPWVLKTLILQESQFWPGSSRYYLAEFGLAQVNDLGADVALRWDYDFFREICDPVLSDCSLPYGLHSTFSQSMLRGALINRLDADCPGCDYSVDLQLARASLNPISHILYANCREANYVLSRYHVNARSYEDLWKLTMVNYHSGVGCLDEAIHSIAAPSMPIDWAIVAPELTCPGARQYVDQFWYSLTNFGNYLLPLDPTKLAAAVANQPSPTEVPYPPVVKSSAQMVVHIYVDANANQTPDAFEGVSGVNVQVTLASGTLLNGVTDGNGDARFDLSGKYAGQTLTVSLPAYYRTQQVILPAAGELQVWFKFSQPNLPNTSP